MLEDSNRDNECMMVFRQLADDINSGASTQEVLLDCAMIMAQYLRDMDFKLFKMEHDLRILRDRELRARDKEDNA